MRANRSSDLSRTRQAGENRCTRVERSAPWRRPLRRARRTIAATLGRLEETGRIIDATARFAEGRALETSRRLNLLNHLIGQAEAGLQRALRSVEQTTVLVAAHADRAGDAPALLLVTTALWLDAAMRLDHVSARAVETSSRLVREGRWTPVNASTVAPRVSSARPHHVRRAPVVVIRRRWFIVAFSVELARKICRGRAPPFDSTARSIHRS